LGRAPRAAGGVTGPWAWRLPACSAASFSWRRAACAAALWVHVGSPAPDFRGPRGRLRTTSTVFAATLTAPVSARGSRDGHPIQAPRRRPQGRAGRRSVGERPAGLTRHAGWPLVRAVSRWQCRKRFNQRPLRLSRQRRARARR
jgi:hypothetical protein